MKKYIFVLICPNTNKVKYVGTTTDPIKKIKFYLNDRRKSNIGDWFKSYGDNSPALKVVKEVSTKKEEMEILFDLREKYKIHYYKKLEENKDRQLRIALKQSEYDLIKKEANENFYGNVSNLIRSKILRSNESC